MTNTVTAATTTPWNSLEIAKLLVSASTPLVLAALGVYIHRITKRFEHLQWRNQKVTEKRIEIYDDLAPLLNDNLCFFTYVGEWKKCTPPDVVASKRKIDKKMHLAAPLFSEEFFSACMAFQELCFETYTGWGEEAKLRTNTERRKATAGQQWIPTWDSLFSTRPSDPEQIRAAYIRIMDLFKQEIGIHDGKSSVHPGRVPANVC